MTLTERATVMRKKQKNKRVNIEWLEQFICEWEDITTKLKKYDCSNIKLIKEEQ